MDQIKNLMSGRAAIVKPRSVLITTRYFWQKWRPLLGNSLAILIMEARRKCYRNLATGEVRNWFYSTIGDLAKSAGFSSKKVLRLLKLPLAVKFIRYKSTFIYNPELGKKVRGKCLFKVLLDDPLIPDDEVGTIRAEMHKPVSFQSPPKPAADSKVVSFEEPPTSQPALNNYSTFQEINIDIINAAVTKSQKGGMVQFYHQIIKELRIDSILTRTILKSCEITEAKDEEGTKIITLNAPSHYYKSVLETELKKRLRMALENALGGTVNLRISVVKEKMANQIIGLTSS